MKRLAGVLTTLCCVCSTWQTADASRVDSPLVSEAKSSTQELLLETELNHQRIANPVLIIRSTDGRLCVGEGPLRQWRLRLPPGRCDPYAGESYYQLSAIPGLEWELDEQALTLKLSAPAQAFEGSVLKSAQRINPTPQTSTLGAFLNYDLLAQKLEGGPQIQKSGLFEFGLFDGDRGVLINTLLAHDTPTSGSMSAGTGSDPAGNSSSPRSRLEMTRLESTWTRDSPETRTTLRVGDAITRSASGWGRSLRYGGIQYATNAATQPYTNYYPVQTVRGEALLPSTVDVMLNNKVVSSHEVPPGPFSLSELTNMVGGGAMQVVVRDVLGRERMVSQPFYASPVALARGVEEFSYEAGAVRQDYGLSSNHYGRHLLAGTFRRGLSNQFTGELHAETVPGQQITLGAGGTFVKPGFGLFSGLFNVNAAWSHQPQGDGKLLGIGVERNLVGSLGFSASAQRTSANFTQLGLAPNEAAPKNLLSASLSYFGGRWGSINLGVISRESQNQERSQLVSANYQVNIQNRATLSISAVTNLSGTANHSLFFLLAIPLGGRISSAISAQRSIGDQHAANEFALQAQQNPAPGGGFGWQFRSTSQGAQQLGGVLERDNGSYRLDVARSASQGLSTRATASGGVAMVGGAPYFGNRINDSFALVQMPDYPGVRVYADNQPVGRTDAQGNAFIPKLRSYEINRIGVNQLDLPLDAKVDAVTVNATPFYRSGIVVRFPVSESRGGMVRIELDDDLPAPVGALIRVNEQADSFPVVLAGTAYLTGLHKENRLELEWRGQHCAIDLTVPPSNDPLPDLGVLHCRGLQR